EFPAQRGGDHRDRHLGVQIGPVALEQRMGLERNKDIEVPGRAAANPRLALAAQPDAGAVLDALGHVDRKGARGLLAALAVAIGAGLVHGLPAPMALGTGLLDGEETLRRAYLAMAAAHAAGGKPGARL